MSGVLLNLAQVARALGVSSNAVWGLVQSGLLPSRHQGAQTHHGVDSGLVAELVRELGPIDADAGSRQRAHRLRAICAKRAVSQAPPVQQPLPMPPDVVTGRAAARELGINPARISEKIAEGELTNLNPVPGAPRAIPVAQINALRQKLQDSTKAIARAEAEERLDTAMVLIHAAAAMLKGGGR